MSQEDIIKLNFKGWKSTGEIAKLIGTTRSNATRALNILEKNKEMESKISITTHREKFWRIK
jgi:DNA-binding MarR family transcriptional regulator